MAVHWVWARTTPEDKHPRMSIDFISWLIAFVLQSALLGKSMHTMITLTDLEADNINPFDCERLVNRFVLAEHVGQAAVTTILLLGRKWLMAAVHLALSAYFVYMYRKNQTYIHANDAFKQLATFKKRRLHIFIVQMVCFVVVAYRLVECAIHTVLTPEGRETVKKLLQESHHFMHY